MNMKKLIESMDRIEECGMTEMPAMAPPAPEMDKGNPVTVNVSMNASGKEHVADLLDMMKNAGLGGAEPVSAKMLSPRMDMERLSGIMDEPGFDDKEMPLPKGDEADMEEVEEGGMKDAVTDMQERLHDFAQEIQRGMHGHDAVVDELNDLFDEVVEMGDPIVTNAFKVLRTLEPEDFGEGEGGGPNRASMVAQDAMDMIDGSDDSDYDHLPKIGEEEAETEDMSGEGTYTIKVKGKNMDSQNELARLAGLPTNEVDDEVEEAGGDYENEPDEQYSDLSAVIPDGDDLHKQKKSHPATAGGDNPMAIENIKAALYAALTEKKKTMVKGPDGKMVPDYAADGKGKGDLKKDTKTTEGRGKVMAGRGRGKDKLMAGRGRGKKK
jgi:uncharacterized protein YidB (DUF937 family)